jgi:ABC-type glycerol-3-phosphate transport system substrate-binding protein
MKTNFKRMICVIFTFSILVCALSACGGSGSSSTTDSKDKNSNEGSISIITGSYEGTGYENFDPYASMPESIKGSTVRFATWVDHTKEGDGSVPLSKLTADTTLNCVIFTVPQNGYVKELMAKMDSGDVPDVFVSNEGDASFPATLQIAAPINKVSTVDLKEPIWNHSFMDLATFDGNVYLVNTIGSPWTGGNLIFFNKTLFEENGIKSPAEYYAEGNWTWTTMAKAMKDIASLGEGYSGGNVDPESLGDTAGTSFVKFDHKTGTFTNNTSDPKLLLAYQLYAELHEEGVIGADFKQFTDGKSGVHIAGVYGLKKNGHFRDMDPADIGFTFMPSLEDGSQALTSGIYRMYGIVEGAPNADAAGYFLRHFLDPTNYDLNDTFISVEAGNFYYELINKTADERSFNFDDCIGSLLGNRNWDEFTGEPMRASSAQVKSAIDAQSNKVDDAIAIAQEIVDSLIEYNKNRK